eukprot:4509680-Karenia_brevis.AAC.1
MVGCAVSMGLQDLALFILATATLYLRPSEALNMLGKDVGFPVQSGQSGLNVFTVTVAPADRTMRSKTGTQDDTILVDHPSWLGPLLRQQASATGGEAPLFRLDARMLRNQWGKVCQRLKVHADLYQLRHT